MVLRHLVLPGIVLPAAIALVAALCDPALFRRRVVRPARSGGPAVAAGLLATYVASGSRPSLPPGEVLGWVFWLVALAGLCGIAWDVLPPAARLGLGASLVGGLVTLLLRPLASHTWQGAREAAWITAATLVALVASWGIQELAEIDERDAQVAGRPAGIWLVGIGLVLTIGAAVTLALAATARLAQLMGALAAALAACGVARLLARSSRTLPGRSGAPPLAIAFCGLLATGFFYAELSSSAWIALSLAPGAAAIVRRRATGPTRRTSVIAFAIAVLLVALAAAPAILSAVTAEEDSYYGY